MSTFNKLAEIHEAQSVIPVSACTLRKIESILRAREVGAVRVSLYTCWKLMDNPVVIEAVARHIYRCAAEAGCTLDKSLDEAVAELLDIETHIEIPVGDALSLMSESRDIAASCALAVLEADHS